MHLRTPNVVHVCKWHAPCSRCRIHWHSPRREHEPVPNHTLHRRPVGSGHRRRPIIERRKLGYGLAPLCDGQCGCAKSANERRCRLLERRQRWRRLRRRRQFRIERNRHGRRLPADGSGRSKQQRYIVGRIQQRQWRIGLRRTHGARRLQPCKIERQLIRPIREFGKRPIGAGHVYQSDLAGNRRDGQRIQRLTERTRTGRAD